jgi:hypothetical protein
MKEQRLSFEEFKALFQDSFESQEELLREYRSFFSIFEDLDQTPVPDFSCEQKAEIFKRAWQERPQKSSWVMTWIDFLRQPAVTFAFGIIVGCIVMSAVTNNRLRLAQTASAGPLLSVEHTKYTQTYKGKMIEEFYPEFENPKIVLEKAAASSPPQRTLYGTLDNGEITVVWNL